MELTLRQKFQDSWNRHFPGIELPLCLAYADEAGDAEPVKPERGIHCMIASLRQARNGKAIAFGRGSIACGGGNRYCGFSPKLRPGFEYFLSYGNETMEGERYKKDPELVRAWLENKPALVAPGRYLIVKRWDLLTEADDPFAVLFFTRPDVLAGLFTLANYDEVSENGVISPMGAGCMTIIQYPYQENQKENPAAIIGMFDISARPSVGANELSFAVPMKRFIRMIENMEESFLITGSWEKLREQPERL